MSNPKYLGRYEDWTRPYYGVQHLGKWGVKNFSCTVADSHSERRLDNYRSRCYSFGMKLWRPVLL